MELWIRSQDKESLTKISNIQYSKHNELHIVGTYYDNLEVLGTYKTKERALEVLDDIQKHLMPKAIMQEVKLDVYELKLIPEICVYQMPEN